MGLADNLIWGNPGVPGRPNVRWQRDNLVHIPAHDLPFPLRDVYTAGHPELSGVTFHRKGVNKFLAGMQNVWNAAVAQVRETEAWQAKRLELKRQIGFDKSSAVYDNYMAEWVRKQAIALLRSFGGDLWGGSWVLRYVRGYEKKKVLSPHAYGKAFDMNPAQNPMGYELITTFPKWYIDAWKDAGFAWGGEFKKRKDSMHFEL